jgi:hypothetical protein
MIEGRQNIHMFQTFFQSPKTDWKELLNSTIGDQFRKQGQTAKGLKGTAENKHLGWVVMYK